MVERHTQAFFAYPGIPQQIGESIDAAVEAAARSDPKLEITKWPQLDTFGASIPDEVRRAIDSAEVFLCDVTVPNRNVYYEVGFAIGRGKPVGPFLNTSFAGAEKDLQSDGLFDVVGYRRYENSTQLAPYLQALPTASLVALYSRPINFRQPLFFLDSLRKSEFRTEIVSSIKESEVFYRSFDPVETPRFTLVALISEITASSGIILPVLGVNIDDASRHNLRCAFLAGLSIGKR